MKKKILIGAILTIAFIALVSAAIYVEPWNSNQRGDNYNLTGVGWITADFINGTFLGENSGTMNWTKLQNYPAACPGGSAITGLNDSVTCSDLWVDVAGDNMTGDLNIDGNLNITGSISNHLSHIHGLVTEVHNVTSGGQWYNLTFNNSFTDLSYLNFEDNRTIVIDHDGHYTINFGMGFKDSASSPNANVGMRVTINGVEIVGSYIEQDTKKQNSDIWSEHVTHTELSAGDKLNMQYISDDTTVTIEQDDTYAEQGFGAYGYIQEIIV